MIYQDIWRFDVIGLFKCVTIVHAYIEPCLTIQDPCKEGRGG